MADPNPQNHWDLLLTDIGATPAAPAEEPRPASPPPAQPAFTPKTPKAKRPAVAPSSASWDALAGQLGLPPAPVEKPTATPPSPARVVAKPRPERPARQPERQVRQPEQPARQPEQQARQPEQQARQPEQQAVKRDRPDSSTPAGAEDSPNFYDESFDFEEPFDLLESPDAQPAAVPAAEGVETDEIKEKRPRRRRRRRRSGRGDSERGEAAEGAAPPSDDNADLVSAVTASEGGIVEEVTVEEVGGEKETEGEPRPKRRRSRRGRRRRPDDKSAPAVAGETRVDESGVRSADELDEDLLEDHRAAVEGEEFDEDDQLEGDQPARLGFRGIPTWEETVGMLVAKNLESRAKRPGGGPHHGRGGRGPRDNRGGRGGDGRRRQGP